MPPNTIVRPHCNLRGMVVKPPKPRTLRRKALEKHNKKNRPKDVVVKVHKVPESAKGPFRHDRSKPFPDSTQSDQPTDRPNPPDQKQADSRQTKSKQPTQTQSTKKQPTQKATQQKQFPPKQSQPEAASTSRKRKAPLESDDSVTLSLGKKHKPDHTSSSEITAPITLKRKAPLDNNDLEEVPVHKKQKTDADVPSDHAESTAPPDQSISAMFVRDDLSRSQQVSPILLKEDGSQRIGFLHLPDEVREMIYELAMDERFNLNPHQSWGNEHPIQKTCKELRSNSDQVFHRSTKFQTNKAKYAYAFIKSRSDAQRKDLSSVRISVPNQARAGEHTLREVRRTLTGFQRTFQRKGLKDGVLEMELPVYNPDTNDTEMHWTSIENHQLYETMEGRRRDLQGVLSTVRVTVLRPADEEAS